MLDVSIELAMINERNKLSETFWTSAEGKRVRQLEHAYWSLTGSAMPNAEDPPEEATPSKHQFTQESALEDGPDSVSMKEDKRTPPGSTVKSLALELFESQPGRAWTFDDMMASFDLEGIALPAKDPRDALRTAVGSLQKKENLVERVGRGTYRFRRTPTNSAGSADTPGSQSVGLATEGVSAHVLPTEDR